MWIREKYQLRQWDLIRVPTLARAICSSRLNAIPESRIPRCSTTARCTSIGSENDSHRLLQQACTGNDAILVVSEYRSIPNAVGDARHRPRGDRGDARAALSGTRRADRRALPVGGHQRGGQVHDPGCTPAHLFVNAEQDADGARLRVLRVTGAIVNARRASAGPTAARWAFARVRPTRRSKWSEDRDYYELLSLYHPPQRELDDRDGTARRGETRSPLDANRPPRIVDAERAVLVSQCRHLSDARPQSFADSNGDGIGDFNGLISKLDYLEAPWHHRDLAPAVLSRRR